MNINKSLGHSFWDTSIINRTSQIKTFESCHEENGLDMKIRTRFFAVCGPCAWHQGLKSIPLFWNRALTVRNYVKHGIMDLRVHTEVEPWCSDCMAWKAADSVFHVWTPLLYQPLCCILYSFIMWNVCVGKTDGGKSGRWENDLQWVDVYSEEEINQAGPKTHSLLPLNGYFTGRNGNLNYTERKVKIITG